MKKTVLSLVVAGSVLVASPILGAAQHNGQEQVTVQSRYEVSVSNWNELIQRMLKQYYANQSTVTQSKQNATQQVPIQTEQTKVEQQPTNQTSKPSPTQQAKPTTKQVATYTISQFEQQVVDLTNQERAKYGLKPLSIDSELSKVARKKSSDMQQKGYFSHNSPTYGSPFDMMKQFGIQYRAAGENIAKGQRSPQEVVQAWMNSEGHRKNILSQNFTHIGVGHVEGNYWTQLFIGK
ncbi:CAP domain-containing protein [Bacillus pinisoli]|uniref:CAP domain-containing protein n=1 Tax=Bacillus pinisoli TaxID=2901866 RepID=UPI001FF32CF9|nr:CAP domain-containing protein [Bacillus pinisoli]